MATKHVPASEVHVCDFCGLEGYLRECWICGREFCLSDQGTVPQSYGFTTLCRDCGADRASGRPGGPDPRPGADPNANPGVAGRAARRAAGTAGVCSICRKYARELQPIFARRDESLKRLGKSRREKKGPANEANEIRADSRHLRARIPNP